MKAKESTASAPYTTPVISTSNPKDWYVFFQFTHEGKVYKKKLRENINRIPDLKKRKIEAEGLREAREAWLKQGWNPIVDPEFNARKLAKTGELKHLLFNEAMDFALAKKKPDISKATRKDYRNILTITKEAAIKTGLAYVNVREVTRLHILNLLQHMFDARNMSNHRYNMYLRTIRAMFTTLETWTICEYNPATKIPNKTVAESDLYSPFTEEEKIKISEHLAEHNYQLFVFLQTVYHTGIRPKELLSVRIHGVDLNRQIITLMPDLEQETTKTPFIRPVPISDALLPFFVDMQLEKYDPEFYLFGTPVETGAGIHGGDRRSASLQQAYLLPSPWQASRDYVTHLWKVLIKDKETGLGIDKCLYAAKHTGADDKILAGIDLDALRNLYGHRSKQMTERYVKQLQEIRNSTIRTLSPSFTKDGKAKVLKIA